MVKRWNAFGVVFAMTVLGISGLIAGTTGKIAGRVVDGENGEPLPGANVVVIASWDGGKESPLTSMMGATSDAGGRYFILNIPPGTYSVEASLIGYNKTRALQIGAAVDRTAPLDFQLKAVAVEVSEVVVTAQRQGVIREQPHCQTDVCGSNPSGQC
jgi:hypothetical protein